MRTKKRGRSWKSGQDDRGNVEQLVVKAFYHSRRFVLFFFYNSLTIISRLDCRTGRSDTDGTHARVILPNSVTDQSEPVSFPIFSPFLDC
jgi:hypothetical protein